MSEIHLKEYGLEPNKATRDAYAQMERMLHPSKSDKEFFGNDPLGDRMKAIEAESTKLKPNSDHPIIVGRLDGNRFSKFTRGLKKPYDQRLTDLMRDTGLHIMKVCDAKVVYHQSDEISVVLYSPDPKHELYFGGRYQKLNSILAGVASAFFTKNLPNYLPEKADCMAVFDARFFEVDSLKTATEMLYWRELDAVRNSMLCAAQTVYSHKQMWGKNQKELLQMLQDNGIDYDAYPNSYKRGSYYTKTLVEKPYSIEELSNLPEKHDARSNPELKVLRKVVTELRFPFEYRLEERQAVFFPEN